MRRTLAKGALLASHPFPAFMNGATAVAIYALLATDYAQGAILFAAVTLSHASIGTMNDCVDFERDMLSQGDKPLVRGYLSIRLAWCLTVAHGVLGAALAYQLGVASLLPFLAILLSGYAYNLAAKGTVWSWVPYAVFIPTIPVWAFLVADHFRPAVALSYLVGAPISAALNVANTIPDLAGDAAHELRGLAHVLGRRRGMMVVWGCLSASLAIVVLFGAPLGGLDAEALMFAGAAVAVIATVIAVEVLKVQNSARLTWYGAAVGSALIGLAWTAVLLDGRAL